jgi:DNA polymerase-3 subunit beta
MKLVISKTELQKGLGRIQAIVEKRNSMPILANAYFEATQDKTVGPKLHIAATDLEVGIRGSHDADVQTPGSLTVSAKKLFEIVRELPDEPLHLQSTANSYLEVQCARSRFVLAGTAGEEYPTLPVASPKGLVRIQAAVLSMMIERTMYAASADETRYNLNGVYFEVLPETGKIRMVATDGHRLAYVDRVVAADLSELPTGVIFPRKGLAELKRLVDEDDADEIELGFEGNSGVARKGDVTLMMRLIEGEFPNYRQVLPKAARTTIVLPKEPLVHALRRVAVLSAERSRSVKVEISEGRMQLSSSNPDLGEAHEELDVDYAGDPLSLGFNARYLLDALGVIQAKEVQLGLQDELSPAQVRPTDDPDSLAVVMPMRI